jgi:hypothetical protein
MTKLCEAEPCTGELNWFEDEERVQAIFSTACHKDTDLVGDIQEQHSATLNNT